MLRPPPPGGRILFEREASPGVQSPASPTNAAGFIDSMRRCVACSPCSRSSCSPSFRRARKPDSTGRAATMPASRFSPAIPRCARRAATATDAAGPGPSPIRARRRSAAAMLATCWLKNQVKPLVENRCCASGVKGAALVEMRPGPVENAIDRIGGDYRNFEIPASQDVQACKQACEGDNRCRAWSFARPGYGGPTRDAISRTRSPRRDDGRAACRAWCDRSSRSQAADGRIHRRMAQIQNSNRCDPGDDRASSRCPANRAGVPISRAGKDARHRHARAPSIGSPRC